MKKIETSRAPGAIGPYSQGFVVNGFVFTSGQILVNPENGEVPEDISVVGYDNIFMTQYISKAQS